MLYWFVFKQLKIQNILILIASYIFYGWWDWRFLSLIIASTLVDYSIGIMLSKTAINRKRKSLLVLSLIFNLGLLGVFKYYNFFIDNWIDLWGSFGVSMNRSSLNIILPVGISFYTFQTLSYTIDVYRKKLTPTKDFFAFAGFVAFFPQLVAGPIERASNLLPQFYKKRIFNYDLAVSGIKLIFWGLFKKIVIADNCAIYVNDVFQNYQDQSGMTLVVGAICFSFQIYGDFSGYSDIAIGTARLFGFDLMRNFNYPYFSRDIAEFWRRWHISLSTWFRDYLYIPLGGSRGNQLKQIRNVFIIFLVSGFWHGANWTFVFWGGLNALFFIPLLVFKRNRNHLNIVAETKIFPSLKELWQITFTFIITSFAWIFFRAESLQHAFDYIRAIAYSDTFFSSNFKGKFVLILMLIFLLIEWFSRKSEIPIIFRNKYRMFFYILTFFSLIYFSSSGKATSFIYFQF
jgi:D-alanyl-lipoteichoic acid acyltransferase DltB (MBOAT superfamily)